jgi:hypothetical protein
MLHIAPSGTRSRAARWRTALLRGARARVPSSWGTRHGGGGGGLGELLEPSGDLEKDFEAIRAFYAPVRGRYPEQETRSPRASRRGAASDPRGGRP